MNSIQANYNYKLNLVKFFREIQLKKQYIKQLKNKVSLLDFLKKKNYKKLNSKLSCFGNSKQLHQNNCLVTYIIDITFSKTNTFIHAMDFSGKLKIFFSAGALQYKGKGKKFRSVVLRDMYKIFISKLKFLKNQPMALHLKNVRFAKSQIIKMFKKKFYIKIIKSFNTYPYNGCRKKKILKEEMAERFKAADCKSVELILTAGSNPAFFNFVLVLNIFYRGI